MAKKPWFYGKNVLISGASSGIGFNIATLLAVNYNAHVIGLARREDKLISAKKLIDEKIKNSPSGGSFDYEVFDVTGNWQELKAKLDNRGFKVDLVINNAGTILPFSKVEDQSEEDVRKVFETNFFSQLNSYKTFVTDLKEAKGGLVNISSSSALCPVIGQAIYSASKAASLRLSEVLRLENKNDFYVGVVCPGYTKTELVKVQGDSQKFDKISMPADKMSKKIVKGIAKKKPRMIFGKDAHAMSGMYRMFPKSTPKMMSNILLKSGQAMFDSLK